MKLSEICRVGSIHKSNSFGEFKVIEYINSTNVIVEFINTKYKTTVQACKVKTGSIKDPTMPIIAGVGFIGSGRHKARVKGKLNTAYLTWRNMIKRCYCPLQQKKQPTYKDCSVVVEWHNFQSFADWFYENRPNDGKEYVLDKDIKIDGNKIYGPGTCMFVTEAENSIKAKAKNYKLRTPCGEIVSIYNMSSFCRENNLTRANIMAVLAGRRNHHKGWTRA